MSFDGKIIQIGLRARSLRLKEYYLKYVFFLIQPRLLLVKIERISNNVTLKNIKSEIYLFILINPQTQTFAMV